MKRIHIIAAVTALLLLTALPAAAKLPPEGRQTLYKAQLLMDKKQYAEAATMIRQYMNSTQEDMDAQIYVVLGGALHKAGKVEQAMEAFQKGQKAFPKDEYLCLNTGVTLYELERYAEAGTYFEKAYSLQKKPDPATLFRAGTAYYMGSRYRDAVRMLDRLLATTTKPKKEWIRLAVHSLIEAGQLGRAENMILRLLNTTPDDAAYWKLLAKLHLDRDEYADAAAALEVCYSLDTPGKQDLERLASLYAYQQAPLMAAHTLRRAYGNTPTAEQTRKVAALLATAGRVTQAVEYLDAYGKTSSVQMEKGKMLYRARRFSEAESTFRTILASNSDPEARLFLALCAWERKDWKLATEELKKIDGLKQFRNSAGYLAVLSDLETARQEAEAEN